MRSSIWTPCTLKHKEDVQFEQNDYTYSAEIQFLHQKNLTYAI